ncbi:hypothetical protein TSUD_90090 [Trifolium subterraneum]|uniref:Glycosyltransferase n=1 Tax=Trifolium subterraneum TaxID=3900 RepID=A0A2Z6NTM3_TRISU|nr:hypothetical protein TSUD_90090 [Trifolium subterraneum]
MFKEKKPGCWVRELPSRVAQESVRYGGCIWSGTKRNSQHIVLSVLQMVECMLKGQGSGIELPLLEKKFNFTPQENSEPVLDKLRNCITPLFYTKSEIVLPGLPKLEAADLPSFLYQYGTYPGYFDILTNQFSNIEQAQWVLVNTFHELEPEVVDWLAKKWQLKTIGPCVPSMFLDKRLKDENDYGISTFGPNSEACIKWLDNKPKDSVVHVSFGSLSGLSEDQTKEIAYGLRDCEMHFTWVVRDSEKGKFPKEFLDSSFEKGLIVNWCPQLQVLTHEAVGCFVTHCGWNSTLEALSVGVPVIAMPLWTDQITNAKFIVDVWKIGVKSVADEKGVVRRETIKDCIKEIMETEKGNEIKKNAVNWKSLAKIAVDKSGSSDKNIEDFVLDLMFWDYTVLIHIAHHQRVDCVNLNICQVQAFNFLTGQARQSLARPSLFPPLCAWQYRDLSYPQRNIGREVLIP